MAVLKIIAINLAMIKGDISTNYFNYEYKDIWYIRFDG